MLDLYDDTFDSDFYALHFELYQWLNIIVHPIINYDNKGSD
ncbi:hypothetical protein [Spiroplasma poulsonii]|nr:hypothetical protein [Spiroplasma poulsonii]KAF0850451.1 Terminase-like family [Spiroplasma poulsonii]